MKSLIASIVLLTLMGCETMKRHPVITGIVITSIAISAAKYGGGGGGRETQPDVGIPKRPNCVNGGCQ